MISIEKAKQLKSLGLIWNPKFGDWYKADYWPTPILFTIDTLRLDNKEIECVIEKVKENTWLPSLDQMLDMFDSNWELYRTYDGNTYVFDYRIRGIWYISEGNSKEDVVADALINLLECK